MSLYGNYRNCRTPTPVCEPIMYCVNKNLTRFVNDQSNDLVNFCEATNKCVNTQLFNYSEEQTTLLTYFGDAVTTYLKTLTGYSTTDTLVLTTVSDALQWASAGGGGIGTVTSVGSGDGMDFSTITTTGTVTMGLPSSVTLSSTNSLSASSHTHAFAPGGASSQVILGDGTLANISSLPIGLTATQIAFGSAANIISSSSALTHDLSGAFISINGVRVGGAFGGNAFLGPSAFTSRTTGTSNAAIGQFSLASTTTGSFNVGVGHGSLYTNTTGSSNTAIGYTALNLSTTVGNNTAVGATAMANTTTGGLNVAVGVGALRFNTTGNQCVAVGVNALKDNTVAIKNTAVGAGAMEETTTGGFNSAFGEDALLHNATGTDNIGIGWLAGSLNTAGNYNLYVGNNAGQTITGGNLNIFLGFNAGYNASQAVTVTNSIALGASTFTTADNQMVLGNTSITAAIVRGTTTLSSYGAGTITGTPTYTLQVDSTGKIIEGGLIPSTPTWEATVTTQGATAFSSGHTTDFGATAQVYRWNGLASTVGLTLSSSTVTGGSVVKIESNTVDDVTDNGALLVNSTGVTGPGAASKYALKATVDRSGSGATNVAGYFSATNGSANYAGQFVRGKVSFGTAGTESGVLEISGSTSGTITIQPAAAAGTYTLTLPTTDGAASEFLQTDGNGVLTWAAASGGTTWNGITDPTGDQALTFNVGEISTWTNSNTTEDLLTINSADLSSGKVINIVTTGTAALTGQTGINVDVSGVNSSASQKTYAAKFTNTHTGTTPSNWSLYTVSGNVGFGDPTSADANNLVVIRNSGNTAKTGLKIMAQNETAFLQLGWGGITYAAGLTIEGLGGINLNGSAAATKMKMTAGGLFFMGGSTTPTAVVHIAAGTASAGTAPLKFTSGTSLTTPEDGAVEFDGTNYFATSSTTRYTLAKTLTSTATLDFPSVASLGVQSLTITVTGAADGDIAVTNIPAGSMTAGLVFTSWVSAANTVTIQVYNSTGSAIDPASGTFRASVIKY